MNMDEFLDDYFYFWRNFGLIFEAAEIQEFHDWLPPWIDRSAERVIQSRS